MPLGSIADWIVGLGTILIAFLAIWGDRVRDRLFGPRIALELRNDAPDCDIALSTDRHFKFLLRVRASNTGGLPAHRVEVSVDSVEQHVAGNAWRALPFIPTCLHWCWHSEAVEHLIPPHGERLFNAVSCFSESESESVMRIETSYDSLLRQTTLAPGRYRLGLSVSAENARVSRWCLEFEHRNEVVPCPYSLGSTGNSNPPHRIVGTVARLNR